MQLVFFIDMPVVKPHFFRNVEIKRSLVYQSFRTWLGRYVNTHFINRKFYSEPRGFIMPEVVVGVLAQVFSLIHCRVDSLVRGMVGLLLRAKYARAIDFSNCSTPIYRTCYVKFDCKASQLHLVEIKSPIR